MFLPRRLVARAMTVRWHWTNYRKEAQAEALWIGSHHGARGLGARCVAGVYGLEIGKSFFGCFRFSAPNPPEGI